MEKSKGQGQGRARPAVVPPLDAAFAPAVLANRAFREDVEASGRAVPMALVFDRGDAGVSRVDIRVLDARSDAERARNLGYVERLVKCLLWARGASRVVIAGPRAIGAAIRAMYRPGGARAFDAHMAGRMYAAPFAVDVRDLAGAPEAREQTLRLGGHLDGCRIGFDLGASDRKACAVRDGEVLYSEEVPWDPKVQTDPRYHHDGIADSLKRAAAHLPRVDAIGGSAAGTYVRNEPRVASLFMSVPDEVFDREIRPIFARLRADWGNVPFEVLNDGDVTALAGSLSLGETPLLGIAMGSSEAAGYVNPEGCFMGWNNELAFVPIDGNPEAPVDAWSGDRGCGVQYFSQEAVGRLAAPAGIELDPTAHLSERLVVVQGLMDRGDARARAIFETIGVYFGYGIAHYADFYDLRRVLFLGRVSSGPGGVLILDTAQRVLRTEFPQLAERVTVSLPDEKSRRVGQSIAAASLPRLPGRRQSASSRQP